MNTEAKRVAYVQSQTVCALIELEAMKAENHKRAMINASPAYGERQFLDLIKRYDIGQNAVIDYLREV